MLIENFMMKYWSWILVVFYLYAKLYKYIGQNGLLVSFLLILGIIKIIDRYIEEWIDKNRYARTEIIFILNIYVMMILFCVVLWSRF